MLISYAQETGMHGHGLDELARLHLGHAPLSRDEVTGTGRNRLAFGQVGFDRATAYAAEQADVVLRLWDALRPRLRLNAGLAAYEQTDRRLVPILLEMERAGVKVDADDLRRMSVDFAARMAVMEQDCHRLAGHPFNVGSPKQLGEVLFDEQKLPGGKRMKTGAWGTDSSVLLALAEQGLRTGEPHPGMAATAETEVDLRRLAGGRHQPGDRAGAYQFRHGDHLDRAVVLERSEFAEYPDPDGGRQPDTPSVYC